MKIKRPTRVFEFELTETQREAKDGSGKKSFPFLKDADCDTLEKTAEFLASVDGDLESAWAECNEIVLASLRIKAQQVWQSQISEDRTNTVTGLVETIKRDRTPMEQESHFTSAFEKPSFSQKTITPQYLSNKMTRLLTKDAKGNRAEIQALMVQLQNLVMAGTAATTAD